MSQEGANLTQEVEGSHDQATAPHGSIPAGIESPRVTMMLGDPTSSSVNKLANAINNAGLSESASPAVLSAVEDNNAASSEIASPTMLHVGKENKAEFKLPIPTVILAGEEKGNNDGPKLASPVMLHDYDNIKAGSHASVDNNAVRSKLASPKVLHAGDGNNGGSKIDNPAVPHAIVDNTTGSKLNSPAVVHAVEDKNARFKLPNPMVLHASKDMDNNARWPKFASPALLHAGEDNKAKTKLAIQAVSHDGGNARSSRLTRSAAAALHAAKDKASKLAIQVVPRPHVGKDKNASLSKAAKLATDNAGESNAKEGKNNVAREQRVDEADVGGGSGKGNAVAVEDADHDLHIFTERERRKKMKNLFSTLHGLLPQLPNKADKATIVGEAVTYIKSLEGTLQKLEKLKMERKRSLAAQQQQQQHLALVAAGSSRASSSSAHHPAPAPAGASSSREASLADMVHQAVVAIANQTLAGGSSSSSSTLPRGAVPFPAPAAGFQTWSGQNMVVSVANNEAFINLHVPRQPGTLTKALFVLERHRIEVLTTTVSTQDGFRMYGIHARVNPASASAPFPENLCAEDRFKLAVSEILQLINIV